MDLDAPASADPRQVLQLPIAQLALDEWQSCFARRIAAVAEVIAAVLALTTIGCGARYQAVGDCQAAGISTGYYSGRGSQCVEARLDPNNQNLVNAAGSSACAKARIQVESSLKNSADPANVILSSNSACESARSIAEAKAWEILTDPSADKSQIASITLPDFSVQSAGTSSSNQVPPTGTPSASAPATIETASGSADSATESDQSNRSNSTTVVKGSIDYLDAKYGFRTLRFGDPPGSTLKLVENDGDLKFYRASDQKLTFGDGQLSTLVFGYYKNQLFSVMMKTTGLTNSRAMMQVLESAYGPGSRPNEFLENRDWFGSRVLLYYKENSITGNASATMSSLEIYEQMQADSKTKADKSANEL